MQSQPVYSSPSNGYQRPTTRPTTRPSYKKPTTTTKTPQSYNEPEPSQPSYNAPSPPSSGYDQPEQVPEQPTYQPSSNSYNPPSADSPLASPEPSYSPPAPAPSYNEPATVEDNFQFDVEEPASGYSAPADDSHSNVPKRQASGFYVGKPPIYTNAVGTPDIWNMFSQEWGGRVSRRRGRINRRRRVSRY